MITFHVTDKDVLAQKAHLKVFFLEEGFTFSSRLEEVAQEVFPNLKALFKHHGFTGALMTHVVIPATINKVLVNCVFVGLGSKGKSKAIDIENLRRAIGLVVRNATSHKADSIACALPSAKLFAVDNEYLGQQTAALFNMAAYHFTDFITDPARKGVELKDVVLCVETGAKKR